MRPSQDRLARQALGSETNEVNAGYGLSPAISLQRLSEAFTFGAVEAAYG
jgi:hypothetical protein